MTFLLTNLLFLTYRIGSVFQSNGFTIAEFLVSLFWENANCFLFTQPEDPAALPCGGVGVGAAEEGSALRWQRGGPPPGSASCLASGAVAAGSSQTRWPCGHWVGIRPWATPPLPRILAVPWPFWIFASSARTHRHLWVPSSPHERHEPRPLGLHGFSPPRAIAGHPPRVPSHGSAQDAKPRPETPRVSNLFKAQQPLLGLLLQGVVRGASHPLALSSSQAKRGSLASPCPSPSSSPGASSSIRSHPESVYS